MCNMPRKPQRKPKPNASLDSGSNSKLGSSSEGVNTTSMKGLAGSAEGLAAKTSNLVGKGVNAVSGYTKPVTNATSNVVNKVSDMSDDVLIKASSKMIDSGNSGAKILGQQLQYAMQQEGPVKNALMWSLSQQPAFRSLINKEEACFATAYQDWYQSSENLKQSMELLFKELV